MLRKLFLLNNNLVVREPKAEKNGSVPPYLSAYIFLESLYYGEFNSSGCKKKKWQEIFYDVMKRRYFQFFYKLC